MKTIVVCLLYILGIFSSSIFCVYLQLGTENKLHFPSGKSVRKFLVEWDTSKKRILIVIAIVVTSV